MRDIKVASRYAKSLLKLAIEVKSLEEIYADMQLIHQVCNENRELVLLLKSPIIKQDKKQAILDAIFGEKLSKTSATFMKLIISKKRGRILSDIAASFIDSYKNYKHIKTAQVTSAVVLSKTQKENIITILKSGSKDNTNTYELIEVVDESIIGGLIVRVGDKQIDESIKRKLTNLEMEFEKNPYVKDF